MTARDETPVPLLARLYSPRYLPALEVLWRLAGRRPVRAVLPSSIYPGVESLARRMRRRSLTCMDIRRLESEPELAFDAIMLTGSVIAHVPGRRMRDVFTRWHSIHEGDGILLLAQTSDEPPATAGDGSLRRSFEALFQELAELEANDMTVTGHGGARLRCRYSVHDLAMLKEVRQTYFDRVTIRPQDVIVDIGAHVGGFCVPCGMQSSGGAVHAFEPSAANFQLLQKNVQHNCPGRVTCHPIAIFNERARLPLNLDMENSANHSLFGARPGNQACMVECYGLSDVLDAVGRPVDLMKVDAEGAEYEFLMAQPQLLRESVRSLMIEAHERDAWHAPMLIQFLSDLGYRVESRQDGPAMMVYADGRAHA